MRKINSFQIGATQGLIGRLPRPIQVNPHTRCLAMICDIAVPVKNTTAGSKDLTNAEAKSILEGIVGSWSMGFGRASVEQVDDALTFSDLRKLGYAVAGRDQRFNGKQLADYSQTDADKVTIAAGATASVKVAVTRFFMFEKANTKLDHWCPYPEQMASLLLSIVRGGAFAAGLEQNGSADVTVYFDEVDADSEGGWANVLRLYKNNDGGLKHSGPPAGGALVSMYEDTQIGSAVPANLTVSLSRRGDSPLHEQIEASSIVRDSYIRRDQSSRNLNDLATELFSLPEAVDVARIPTSSNFELTQSSQALSPMQTRWIYAPTVTPQYADGVAGPNIAAEHPGEGRKMITNTALTGEEVPGNVSATVGIASIPLNHPKADMFDGRIATQRGTVVHFSPVLNAAMKGLGSDDASAAAGAELSKKRAKSMPGARSPQRGIAGPGVSAIAEAGAPAGLLNKLRGFLRG